MRKSVEKKRNNLSLINNKSCQILILEAIKTTSICIYWVMTLKRQTKTSFLQEWLSCQTELIFKVLSFLHFPVREKSVTSFFFWHNLMIWISDDFLSYEQFLTERVHSAFLFHKMYLYLSARVQKTWTLLSKALQCTHYCYFYPYSTVIKSTILETINS